MDLVLALYWLLILVLSLFLYGCILKLISEFKLLLCEFSLIWTSEPRGGMQKNKLKHYYVQVDHLPPTTTLDILEDMFEEFGFLGTEIHQNIVSGECTGTASVYLEDINGVKAAMKKISDLKYSGSYEKVDQAWSGFPRLSERIGACGTSKLGCYGVGAYGFGEFCFKCGLPGHFARHCKIDESAGV